MNQTFSKRRIGCKITLLVVKEDTYKRYNILLHVYLIFVSSDHDESTNGSFGY
jgi:hypothetical protein